MAKRKDDVNKSEEIRKLLRANPQMPAQEIISTLAAQGIKVQNSLVYFIKGKMKRRKGRRKKAHQMVAKVAATGTTDPVRMVLMIKSCAGEIGGLRKLKALVDALSE